MNVLPNCLIVLFVILLTSCLPDNQGEPKPEPGKHEAEAGMSIFTGKKKMEKDLEAQLNRLESEIHAVKEQLRTEADRGYEKVRYVLRDMEKERDLLNSKLEELRLLSNQEYKGRQEEFDAYITKVQRKVDRLIEQVKTELATVEKSAIL